MLSATMQTLREELPPAAISVWWSALSAYDIADVRRALSDHIKTPEKGRWAPTPADVIGRIEAYPKAHQPRLDHKKMIPAPAVMERMRAMVKPKTTGRYWTVDKVVNQAQVDFIKRQADHFGHMSEAHRFLLDCQAAGCITHDYRLGRLNVREPGEDPIEDEEAA